MKDKNVIYIVAIIVVIILLIGVVFGIYTKKESLGEKKVSLKYQEVANLKKSEVELPEFKIDIDGAYVGTLDKVLLEAHGIQVYEFDAAVDNGWDIVTNHYTGVKLKDVMDIMIQDAPYTRLEFHSKANRSAIYNKEEITDNMYLIFNRDDKPYGEKGLLTFLAVDFKYKYSIENVAKITLSNYDPFKDYDEIMKEDNSSNDDKSATNEE